MKTDSNGGQVEGTEVGMDKNWGEDRDNDQGEGGRGNRVGVWVGLEVGG